MSFFWPGTSACSGESRLGQMQEVVDDNEGNHWLSQISARGIDKEEGPKDIYHPTSVQPHQTIWTPRDPLD